jgi:hypothetical protein
METLKAFIVTIRNHRAAELALFSSPFMLILTMTTIPYYTNTHWDTPAILAMVIQLLGNMSAGVLIFLALETFYLTLFNRGEYNERKEIIRRFFGKA